jgi:hypothetical protein
MNGAATAVKRVLPGLLLEHDPFRKPVSTPDQVRAGFGIML